MNLRQLQYIAEIAKQQLNMSAAAEALDTNQSGISKQLKLLETELGVQIFIRSRNKLSGITPHGRTIIDLAQNVLTTVANIRAAGEEGRRDSNGSLVIGITHTQARYVMPGIMKRFSVRHPRVRMRMRHTDPGRIIDILLAGEVDIAVVASEPPESPDLLVLPFRQFHRVVIVPKGHRLLRVARPTLKDIAQYPIVTYEPGYSARQELVSVLQANGLEPKIAVSAVDADVIKTCVEQGLGISLMSELNYDAERDPGLRAVNVSHLFKPFYTKIVLSKQRLVRRHTLDFIDMCVPKWDKSEIAHMVVA